MKVHQFLEHHGIAGNPFAEEDAQNDTVFKRTCLETTFHPSWDKVYGDPSDPSTAIVFGEKGSGKTALKLQMVRQFERHNEAHPDARTFVVLYDDFNPFLDRFVSRVGKGRAVEKVLGQWKLWDHMDAILTLSVTQLVTQLVGGSGKLPRLTHPQARDLALLAACYDQSTAESFPRRWLRSTWRAWRIVGSMRSGNRTVGQLARALCSMPEVDLAGQPLPALPRSDDRYELMAKLQGVLAALGWKGWVVIVDRLDEPDLINGSAERMRQVIWPMLDNKFLKVPGLGFKMLLPQELYRFIERESEEFHQRARLDKQNLVPSLEWTGETLYDIASTRVKAASVGTPPATLAQLFDPAIDQRRLIDGLRSLRVPRQLFKFLYRLLVAHCHSHTDEQAVYTISPERFESELALFRRDQDAFDRGLAPR